MNLFEKPRGVQTRWISFENPTSARGAAALENKGGKGHPCDCLKAGETKTLLDVTGSGLINRIWLTVRDRSPEMLRSLRLDMFWDHAVKPAVSCPLGDFFGIGLGRRVAFESALFSDPEGRSFNCFIPMPFRKAARITLTNESGQDLSHVFYDVNLLLNLDHSPETLYFHAHWRRESPNELGRDFLILPPVPGSGRFLGCNIGVIANPIYEKAWWGEGEVKVWFGADEHPTLCGTGTEDYIGTAWGQGQYAHRTQGCPVADAEKAQWCFYRYHVDDPVFFDDGCRVAIQTMGGCKRDKTIALMEKGAPIIPAVIDPVQMTALVHLQDMKQPVNLRDPAIPGAWCNFWRQDDWSATAYFYLNSHEGVLPPIPPAPVRAAGLTAEGDTQARADA
jgi:hypothetical protein